MTNLEEIDVTTCVRPELFFTPDVYGLTVPVSIWDGDRNIRRWRLYLQWADGRRECRDLPGFLDMPDGKRIWFTPELNAPPRDMEARWSITAREAWLNGSPTPDRGELFQEINYFISSYLDFTATDDDTDALDSVTSFVFLTYCYPAFPSMPYLAFIGPCGSGKTRALRVLQSLVFRPICATTPSSRLLAQYLHTYGGTLLLDQAEALSNPADLTARDITDLLYIGTERGGTWDALESVDGRYQPVSYNIYGPKALASRACLPELLFERGISIQMLGVDTARKKAKRSIDYNRAQMLRDALHAYTLGRRQGTSLT